MLRVISIMALVGASAGSATAQVVAGDEFRVNTTTASAQWDPHAASAPDGDENIHGNFVVTWTGLVTPPAQYDVFAQRYRPWGVPVGGEFRVNDYTTGVQRRGRVTVHRDGSFVIVWMAAQAQQGLWAQRFSATGARIGTEFRVDTTGDDAPSHAIGMDRRGDFVVAWWDTAPSDADGGVFAQRVSAGGALVGGEFRVNTYTTGTQSFPAVAMGDSGDFAIAWMSADQDGSGFGVFAQRFAAAGTPIGGEFRVHAGTVGDQLWHDAATDRDGNLVVAWTEGGRDGSGFGVFARRFSSTGAPLGGEFLVNTYTTGQQNLGSVRAGEAGSFVVAWNSVSQDGDGDGVFAQRFRSDGTRRGFEYRVNRHTTSSQAMPAIAHDGVGNVTVAWTSLHQDGDDWGIYAQRFGGLLPRYVGLDDTGNRILEPGETVRFFPTWSNVSGFTQSFSGTLVSLSGPPGTVVTGVDTSASYGTLPPLALAPCQGDCYRIAVAPIPVRPAAHLDATVVERIVPDGQGQEKRWVLHIGGSYSDVPRTSSFYSWVEALLHQGVTTGCSATTYCPASSTTREQMAVFVLAGREGADYRPPACGATPMFADVPASSPYCRWIEELARRGVVGGCGGGNYCPASPVSREQMAVFAVRTMDPTINPTPCSPPTLFADVPETSSYCRWIEWLAQNNIVGGCGGGNYCPADPVTREQMAVFIARTFGLLLYTV